MKIYILYYEFNSTKGNHAGMAYLARYLAKNNSSIKLIRHIPQEYKGGKYIGAAYSFFLMLYLSLILKKTDKVFFMEYISDMFAYQHRIAGGLRYFGKKNEFVSLIHLSGKHLLEIFASERNILKKLAPIDKIVVFGSTLKAFIERVGFKGKVIRTYHYVDNDFYKPFSAPNTVDEYLNVIFVGNLKRNFDQLKEIIKSSNQNIHYHICMGRSKVDLGLPMHPNVKYYGFLSEDQLLGLMQKCNVNLSVLSDTVGSNAITSSLAVGLVQVVSNVGSIKDYCDESNSFLCDTSNDFLDALKTLDSDFNLLKKMQLNALARAQEFSIKSFSTEFLTFFS